MCPHSFLNISFGNLQQEPFAKIFQRMRTAFPTPFSEWACARRATEIYQYMQDHGITQTPIPYPLAQEMVARWTDGTPTPLYKKMGIYDQT